MIVVDTTVWIGFFRGTRSPEVRRLDAYLGTEEILVGDLILCELLQGCDSEQDAAAVRAALGKLDVVAMVGPSIAEKAAANYRALRRRGVTVRKTIDLLIGTFCIESRFPLLHADRDFLPMSKHLGLETV